MFLAIRSSPFASPAGSSHRLALRRRGRVTIHAQGTGLGIVDSQGSGTIFRGASLVRFVACAPRRPAQVRLPTGRGASLWLLYPLLAVVFLRDAVFSGGAYASFATSSRSSIRGRLRCASRCGPARYRSGITTSCGIPPSREPAKSGGVLSAELALLVLSFDHALTIGMVLHLALAAIFLRAFLRRTGVEEPAARFWAAHSSRSARGRWRNSVAPMKLGARGVAPRSRGSGTWDAMREGRRARPRPGGLGDRSPRCSPEFTRRSRRSRSSRWRCWRSHPGIELLFSRRRVPLPGRSRSAASRCRLRSRWACCSPAYGWRRPAG